LLYATIQNVNIPSIEEQQLKLLMRCIRDPKLSARHRRVLAKIIDQGGAADRETLEAGVAFYDATRTARRYSRATLDRTVADLIRRGYIGEAS
jgi:hypothetical protein